MRTLILSDNQEITKAGLLYLTDRMDCFLPIVEAENRLELLALLDEYPQAVVILDYTLFDFNGVEDLLVFRERFPHVYWLLFSDELSDDFMRRLFFANDAFNVILKEAKAEEIQEALKAASENRHFICKSVKETLLYHKSKPEEWEKQVLTATEREILKSIALGKTTKEIAAERFSSVHTIMTHRKNIFRKLAVNNIYEATKYALRAGIVDTVDYYI